MKQNTALDTALEDATTLIEALELPYLEALQKRLAQHIEMRRVIERASAVEEIRRIAARLGMSVDELMTAQPPKPARATTAKYRDPETGAPWSGIGREPLWIKGKDREQFRIAQA